MTLGCAWCCLQRSSSSTVALVEWWQGACRVCASGPTWRHQLWNTVASKRLLWKPREMSINDVGVPPAKHMQPGALDVQEVGFIHQGDLAVCAAATPYRTLHSLLGQLGGVAGLQQKQHHNPHKLLQQFVRTDCCTRFCKRFDS